MYQTQRRWVCLQDSADVVTQLPELIFSGAVGTPDFISAINSSIFSIRGAKLGDFSIETFRRSIFKGKSPKSTFETYWLKFALLPALTALPSPVTIDPETELPLITTPPFGKLSDTLTVSAPLYNRLRSHGTCSQFFGVYCSVLNIIDDVVLKIETFRCIKIIAVYLFREKI
ncbi:MAG: hypothetical protein R3D34_08795 [Nitratireductor sp.]